MLWVGLWSWVDEFGANMAQNRIWGSGPGLLFFEIGTLAYRWGLGCGPAWSSFEPTWSESKFQGLGIDTYFPKLVLLASVGGLGCGADWTSLGPTWPETRI